MLNTLRALLLIALAWQAAAQSAPVDRAQAARDLVSKAAQALGERRAAGFLEALDPPLAEKLRKPIESLVRSYDIQPALEFFFSGNDDRGVALGIDWKLDLTAREGQRSITHRQKRVSCRVEQRDGGLRIVAFSDKLDGAPGAPGLFSPPDVDGAWDLLQSAARALSQPDTPTAGFLASFDSKLPDYEALRTGAIVIDSSTISPVVSRKMACLAAGKGASWLDAAVTGSKHGAEKGELTFMIGGDQAVFNRIRPLLDPMGKKIYFCGAAGMGLQAKLTQNLILSNILMAFNEGMVLATKGGMDPALMLEILDNSAARSGLISYKAPFVFARNFTTNFSVKWMHKDIGLMLESGQELGVPLLLTGLTRQLFQTAISAGHGDEDICSTIKVLEEFAGVEVNSQK